MGMGAVFIFGAILTLASSNNTVPNIAPNTVPPSPTIRLPPPKATLEQGDIETEEAAAKTPTRPFVSRTPDIGPTSTPFYGDCPPRPAGAGQIFDHCAIGAPLLPALRSYAILNAWSEGLLGWGSLDVYAGGADAQGVLVIYPPGADRGELTEVYLTPIQDGLVEIVDAQGEQLVLRTLNHQQTLYFDVPTRQFIESLSTAMPTATPITTATATANVTP